MIIKHIFDGDFGCEESSSKEAMVSVTLVDEDGQESYVTIEDDWLREHGLDVGSQWPEYLIRICERNMLDKLGLDEDDIVNAKMAKNEAKYPVDKAKGKADKYDRL